MCTMASQSKGTIIPYWLLVNTYIFLRLCYCIIFILLSALKNTIGPSLSKLISFYDFVLTYFTY